MWDKIKHFVGEHPYATAAGVFGVGILVIIVLSRGSSNSASTAAPDDSAAQASVDEAQIQSATQLQAAGLAASTQNNQTQAQLSALQANDATELGIAQLSEQLGESTNTANENIAYTTSSLGAVTVQANDAAQVAITQSNNASNDQLGEFQKELGIAQIQSEAAAADQAAQFQEQTTVGVSNNATQVEDALIARNG